MGGETSEQVLQRIDRALARIEAGIARPAPANDTGLAARHDALRDAVVAALGELDALIGTDAEASSAPGATH